MKSLTNTSGGWLRKAIMTGTIPLLLVQLVIALFWVPQTLEARSEIFRKMTWEQLPAFLEGEERVTIVLSEGGAVRGEVIGVPGNGIHLGRVSMTTDGWRFPTGSDALVPRSSVKEIRVEKRRGLNASGELFWVEPAQCFCLGWCWPRATWIVIPRETRIYFGPPPSVRRSGVPFSATGWASARMSRPPSLQSPIDDSDTLESIC